MILPQTSQYALRVMTYIALSQGARPITAKEITAKIKCPTPYLSKVLRRLVTGGLLKAEKGHGGGFLLARSPEKIFFCQILETIQASGAAKQCIFGWRKCDSRKPCILHHRWSTVSDTFTEWTKTTSLAEVQSDAKGLDWILNEDTK